MKLIWIAVIIIAILVIVAVYILKVWNNIVFKFAFKGVDLSTLDLGSLAASGQTSGKLLLGLNIENHNSFSIPFDKMKVWLYYDNTLIAESSGYLYARSFKLPANGKIDVTDYVSVYINSASGKLLKEVASKNDPKVYYKVKITIFGLQLTYEDYFVATI